MSQSKSYKDDKTENMVNLDTIDHRTVFTETGYFVGVE